MDLNTGTFSGTGYYIPDPSLTSNITGTVMGSTVNFTMVYNLAHSTNHVTGTIANNGTMSGTSENEVPQGFSWTTTLGNAFARVKIDIKPNSDPNSINLGSEGKVPVAILSTDDFDATDVVPVTVTLAGAHVALKGKGTPMSEVEDVNNDGLPDLIVHVDTYALNLTNVDTTAVLEGQTNTGMYIRGTDTVRIVPQ
jgi:hypothetical protein